MSGSGLMVMGAKAPAVSLPALRRRGHCFETVTGQRWTGIECSDFNLFGRFLNGEDIAPVLQQRADAGFNLLRVWTRYQLSQYGIGDCTLALHPELYERLPDFLGRCGRRRCYVELTAYTGREDFDAAHWDRLGEAVKDAPNVFLSLVNENDQPGNHLDLTPYQKHPNILCSRGSNGSEQWPPAPPWDFRELHTNGAFEEQRKIGHNAMELWDGPSWATETSRYPDVGMWAGASLERQQQLAFDSAAASVLLCAGSGCFHSRHGKNSTLWDEQTEAVARSWAAGAKSVLLDYQDGSYRHASELETPNLLRVYQRILPDGRAWTAEVRR